MEIVSNELPEIIDETYDQEKEIGYERLMSLLDQLHTEEKSSDNDALFR